MAGNMFLIAQGEGLFLDKLHLVAGNPLTYVAFVLLALAWTWRAYFLRTQQHLLSLEKLPDKDKLNFSQMVLLGFPRTLTKNHMIVMRWRYLFGAWVATLIAIAVMGGLVVHYWSMPKDEIQRTLGRMESENRATAASQAAGMEEIKTGQRDLLIAVGNMRERLETATYELQRMVSDEMQSKTQFIADVEMTAASMNASSSEQMRSAAGNLELLVKQYRSQLPADKMSEEDGRVLRLADATIAIAKKQYERALELVTDADIDADEQAAKARLNRAASGLVARAQASMGLARWTQALGYCERALKHRPGDLQALHASVICLMVLSRHQEALERCTAIESLFKKTGLSASLRAAVLSEMGRHEEAVAEQSAAIESLTQDQLRSDASYAAGLYRIRSQYLSSCGKADEAISDLEKSCLILGQHVGKNGEAREKSALGHTLLALANSYDKVGKTDQAMAAFERALETFRSLPVDEVTDEVRYAMADALGHRGDLHARMDQKARAEVDYKAALAGLENRPKAGPIPSIITSRTLSLRAGLYQRLGKLGMALSDCDQAIRMGEALRSAESKSTLVLYLLPTLHEQRSMILLAAQRPEEAVEELETASRFLRELLQQSTASSEPAPFLISAECERTRQLQKLGRLDDASRSVSEAEALTERFQGQIDTRKHWKEIAACRENQAYLFDTKEKETDTAIKEYGRAITILGRLDEERDDSELRLSLGRVYWNRGLAWNRKEKSRQAIQDIDKCVEIRRSLLAEKYTPSLARDLASAAAYLGQLFIYSSDVDAGLHHLNLAIDVLTNEVDKRQRAELCTELADNLERRSRVYMKRFRFDAAAKDAASQNKYRALAAAQRKSDPLDRVSGPLQATATAPVTAP